MQTIQNGLPVYDEEELTEEMSLFEQWYLNRHLSLQLNKHQQQLLQQSIKRLVSNAMAQPQVFVHRDYHSRNLMITEHNNPGVIDYQDAVFGPITYDLVSLFKDCYIEWPRERVEHWLDEYLVTSSYNFEREQFIQWFDLMGVQRHLKVLGTFSRLNYRDGKSHYLADLPLTLKYLVEACARYDELEPLHELLQQIVIDHPAIRHNA